MQPGWNGAGLAPPPAAARRRCTLCAKEEEGLPRVVGHSGGFPGISSNLSMFLDSGYTLAVLSNQDAGSMDIVELFKGKLRTRPQHQPKGETPEKAIPPPR